MSCRCDFWSEKKSGSSGQAADGGHCLLDLTPKTLELENFHEIQSCRVLS
jgi:hypothetical protein